MDDRGLLGTGIAGTAIAVVCCFTPALVILLGALGLSAWLAWLDFVLLGDGKEFQLYDSAGSLVWIKHFMTRLSNIRISKNGKNWSDPGSGAAARAGASASRGSPR